MTLPPRRTSSLLQRGAVLGSTLLLVFSQAVACNSDDPIALTMSNQPLANVIEAIAIHCGIAVVSSDDLSGQTSIGSLSWSATETLRRLLRQHSYILQSDRDGQPRRLRIFGSGERTTLVPPDPLLTIKVNLTDSDPDVRSDAVLDIVDSMAGHGEEGRWLLNAALDDPDPSVRSAADAALDAISTPD